MYKKLSREEERIIRESISYKPVKKGRMVTNMIWFIAIFLLMVVMAYIFISSSNLI